MFDREITFEQIIEFLEENLQKQELFLNGLERQILKYSYDDIAYEKMDIYGYSIGSLKNIASELFQKITKVLRGLNIISDNTKITKKNFRVELAPIVKLYRPTSLSNEIIDNRFVIKKLKSKGLFGNTYIGEHLHLPPTENKCSIKQLRVNPNENNNIKFNREIGALYQLRWHPQIPYLVDHCQHKTGYYLVYQYIEGSPLSEELSETTSSHPWSETETIQLMNSILNVLKFIHQKNIIHRDIKPSNLIRKPNGEIVLINFGSIKELRDNNNMRTFSFSGTKGYMAPEQSYGKPSQSSDLFCLGMLAVQAITGLPPTQFKIDDENKIIWDKQISISPELKEILEKMIEFNVTERYQSAEAVEVDLVKLTELKKS